MAGKSPVTVDEEQKQGVVALSHSRGRREGGRARAILLTLSGWTSGQIAEAFGVREDTVRVWRSAFMTGGIEALKTSVAPGPLPSKRRPHWLLRTGFWRGRWRTARIERSPVSQMKSRGVRA